MMINLARGFSERGFIVDMVLVQPTGDYIGEVPQSVRVVDLKAMRVSRSVPALVRYLRREMPSFLLSTLNTANLAAVVAKRISGTTTRTVLRQSTVFFRNRRSPFSVNRTLLWSLVRYTYPSADAVIAVSQGVAEDLARIPRLPADRIHVVPNPVVTDELLTIARMTTAHPWLAPGAPPVVLGAGRLTEQKDFATLVHAFARVRRHVHARLLILGEGEERSTLQELIRRLGIEDCVQLAGFVSNPFAFMSRAAVFVLSSAWEGLPSALIQAMACGAPVVASDCKSGPREILGDGRYGQLVPVGDAGALATAILSVLLQPRQGAPREAWASFTLDNAVDRYLRVLLGRVA
jgi:glycosyltransferase involved in cell wall biosynthesis